MTENIYILIHDKEQYKKFIKEIQENYNSSCTYDQYGYIRKEFSDYNTFPSMFMLNKETSIVRHQPIMQLTEKELEKYIDWTNRLISIDDFVKLKKNKYTVTVEFTKTTVMLADIDIYSKSINEARRIAFKRSKSISEEDMRESEDSMISVNRSYWKWNAEEGE